MRAPLGTGDRFSQLSSALARRPGVASPDGLAAAIGAKRYGRARMQKWAADGKRRA